MFPKEQDFHRHPQRALTDVNNATPIATNAPLKFP